MEAGRQRQFHIHHCLGRGGYGEVYRATMMAPGGIQSDVAVKLLRVDLDPGAEAVRRLRDEGKLLSVLRHPAILRVFDLALLEGRVGLVTEYVEGEDLATLIGILPIRASIEVMAVVAEALDAAWNHPRPDGQPLHLVHRDIKPSNVRIGVHGEVKVLDFGIARSMADQTDREARTGTGSTVGSLPYMAPERFGRAPSAPAADVYGLGCTLYEALAGSRVFVDAVPVEMFRLASDGAAYETHLHAAMARLPLGLDRELVTLVRGMLAYAAEARPTAAEVRTACESMMERLPGDPLRRWARERSWPNPRNVQGYLEGRVITEGTLSHHSESVGSNSRDDDRSSDTFRMDLQVPDPPAPVVARPAVAPTPARRRWKWVGALVVAGIAVVAGFGRSWIPTQGEAEASNLAQPVPTARVPAPVPVPVVEPDSVVVVAPVPMPVAVPVPPPQIPVLPRPMPELVPVPPPFIDPVPVLPAPMTYGTVKATPAEVRIELHHDAQSFRVGQVPSGRYELYADFGSGMTNLGRYVDVVEGYETVIRCNTLRYVCDVAN